MNETMLRITQAILRYELATTYRLYMALSALLNFRRSAVLNYVFYVTLKCCIPGSLSALRAHPPGTILQHLV